MLKNLVKNLKPSSTLAINETSRKLEEQGKKYLNTIKKDLTVPLITKIKAEKHPYLEHELRASKIYSLMSDRDIFKQEFKPVIII